MIVGTALGASPNDLLASMENAAGRPLNTCASTCIRAVFSDGSVMSDPRRGVRLFALCVRAGGDAADVAIQGGV